MSWDPRRALDRARDILDAIANIQNHEYFRVDAGIVWETVQHELPVLEKMLRKFVLKESV